jgi:hypothetical protein
LSDRAVDSALEGLRWTTVVGGLCVVFGVLGVFWSVGQFFQIAMARSALEEAGAAGAFRALGVLWWSRVLELLVCGAHVGAGVGVLLRRRWAVGLVRGYAVADLGANTLGAFGLYLLVRSLAGAEGLPDRERMMFGAMSLFGAAWQWVLASIWPALLLVWFGREAVRVECAGWAGSGRGGSG